MYIVLSEAQDRIDENARTVLDAPGNPARKTHSIALLRALADGESLVVHIELAGFDVLRTAATQHVIVVVAHAGPGRRARG